MGNIVMTKGTNMERGRGQPNRKIMLRILNKFLLPTGEVKGPNLIILESFRTLKS